MLMIHARAVCAATDFDVAWDVIRDNHEYFLWTDDEYLPSTWNRLYGSESERRQVEEVWDDDKTLRYVYRGRSQLVPLQWDRIDKTICMHALAQVVQSDIEIRFCRDSDHSSDLAFFGLPPQDWMALEQQYGAEAVTAAFLKIAPIFYDFMKQAFSESDKPRRPVDPTLTDWAGGGTYNPDKLHYLILFEEPGKIRRETLVGVIDRHLAPGPINVSIYGSTHTTTLDRKEIPRWVAKHIDARQLRMWDANASGFVVVERKGEAAGWRFDGVQLEPKRTKPWCKLWE